MYYITHDPVKNLVNEKPGPDEEMLKHYGIVSNANLPPFDRPDIVLPGNLAVSYGSSGSDIGLCGRRNCTVLAAGQYDTVKNTFLRPNLGLMNCNYVISDPDGTLWDEFGLQLVNAEYKVTALNFEHPERSYHFNPLSHIEKVSDVSMISKNLLKKWQNPDISTSVVEPLLDAMLAFDYAYLSQKTFSRILSLAESGLNAFEMMIRNYVGHASPNYITIHWQKFRNLAKGNADDIYRAFLFYLQDVLDRAVIEITEEDDFSDTDEKYALFIASDAWNRYSWLSGLVASEIIYIRANHHDFHAPWIRLLLDNSFDIWTIPEAESCLSILHAYRLSVIMTTDNAAFAKRFSAFCDLMYVCGNAPDEIKKFCMKGGYKLTNMVTDSDNVVRTVPDDQYMDVVRKIHEIPADIAEVSDRRFCVRVRGYSPVIGSLS